MIFQISGDLTMRCYKSNLARSELSTSNIFWQVVVKPLFGTTSHLRVIILSMTVITFQTGKPTEEL
jgi:hypothetical protein